MNRVDHNIEDLPEFSVYASEENPYGTADAQGILQSTGIGKL